MHLANLKNLRPLIGHADKATSIYMSVCSPKRGAPMLGQSGQWRFRAKRSSPAGDRRYCSQNTLPKLVAVASDWRAVLAATP